MTALYDHAYSTNPGNAVARGTLLDCGHTLRAPDDGTALGRIGTGYAGIPDSREVVCYPCAEDREAAAFATADAFPAYDVLRGAGHAITTWTGRELARERPQ
jgi:hypothetical protein